MELGGLIFPVWTDLAPKINNSHQWPAESVNSSPGLLSVVSIVGLGSLGLGGEDGVLNLEVGDGSEELALGDGLNKVRLGSDPLLLDLGANVLVLGSEGSGLRASEGKLGLLVSELGLELADLGLDESVAEDGTSGGELATVGSVGELGLEDTEAGGGAHEVLDVAGAVDSVVDGVLGVLPRANTGDGAAVVDTVATVATDAAVDAVRGTTDAALEGKTTVGSLTVAGAI